MGKDLRGKKCGKGISQRKDKWYVARYIDSCGVRHGKLFKTLPEARNWRDDMLYKVRHGEEVLRNEFSEMTVGQWYDYWKNNIRRGVKLSTQTNQDSQMRKYVIPIVGDIKMKSLTAAKCQEVANSASLKCAPSTVKTIMTVFGQLADAAMRNEVITKNPVKGVRLDKAVSVSDTERALDKSEREALISAFKGALYEEQFLLAYETGLRVGEISAITINDFDLCEKKLYVSKSLSCLTGHGWEMSTPKSNAGCRMIPLTNTAVRALEAALEKRKELRLSNITSAFEYFDERQKKSVRVNVADLLFLNKRNTGPIQASVYDRQLDRLSKNAGIKKKVSMHTLRRTYATSCVERGMNVKVLQKLMGHSDLSMTMKYYVHLQSDAIADEVARVSLV